DAFRANDDQRAFKTTVEYFMGPGAAEQLPPEVAGMLRANMREWRALTTSSDAFPMIDRKDVQALRMPVLMLSGEKTYAPGKIIDDELARLIPSVQRQV